MWSLQIAFTSHWLIPPWKVDNKAKHGQKHTRKNFVRLHSTLLSMIWICMWKRELQTEKKKMSVDTVFWMAPHKHIFIFQLTRKTYDTVLRGINKKDKITLRVLNWKIAIGTSPSLVCHSNSRQGGRFARELGLLGSQTRKMIYWVAWVA